MQHDSPWHPKNILLGLGLCAVLIGASALGEWIAPSRPIEARLTQQYVVCAYEDEVMVPVRYPEGPYVCEDGD